MKLKNLAIIGAAAAAFHLGFSYFTYHEVFERNAKLPGKINNGMKKKDAPAEKKPEDPRVTWMHGQEFLPHTIKNERGETLCGYYLKAEKETNRYVLCSHGYRNRGKGEFRFISKFYHENGFNIFLVDHVASGESEGKAITFGYYESADLLKWIDYMKETFGEDIEIILHGVSMGCATVDMLAGNESLPENVRFIISDCGYTSVKAQFESVLSAYHIPYKLLMVTVDFINKRKNGYALSDVCPLDSIRKARVPMLFIHGGGDGLVPVKMARAKYECCHTDKDLLIVEKAGHASSYQKNSDAYEAKILAFAEKYTGSDIHA